MGRHVNLSTAKGDQGHFECFRAHGIAEEASPASCLDTDDCDVDACFDRCESMYEGEIGDGSQGDAYMCAKGCAGMGGGRVKDRMRLQHSSHRASCGVSWELQQRKL